MTDEEAIAVIEEGLVGPESLPVKLRMRLGLDRDLLARVKEAILLLTERWKDRGHVPKRVATAFVDLGNSMQWGWSGYSEEEQRAIEVASIQLVDLGYELFAEPESPSPSS